MRRPLDILYAATAALGGVALVSIALLIIGQVVARWLGTQIRAADDFAGFALVATNFLALAPTYRKAEHIRVGLLIERISGRPRRMIEALVLIVAVIAMAWTTWWIGRFVYDSWQFNEVAQGLVAVPLWIPQMGMLIGVAVFAVALAEDLIAILVGRTPTYLQRHAAADGPGFER